MMRFLLRTRLLLTLTLLVATYAAQAQPDDKLKIKARICTDPAADDKRFPQNLFAVNDRTILVVRNTVEPGLRSFAKVTPKMELYDRAKLNVLRSQEPTLKVRAGQLFLQDVVRFNKQPVMIAARRDTLKGRVELYWQNADPNLTKNHPPFEPICQFDAQTFGFGKKIEEGSAFRDVFQTAFSPDTNLLLVHAPYVLGNDGKPRHLMVVVDPSMNVVWQRTLDVPFNDRLEEVQLDNKGNIYALVRKPFTPKDPKNDTTSYALELQYLNASALMPCATGLERERTIKSARLRALPDGRILMAGMHGGPDPKGDMTLVTFVGQVADGEAKLDISTSWKFEYDTEDAWMAKGVRLLDMLPRKDGGMFVLSEYYLQTDKAETKMALGNMRWVHGPIVVTSLDEKGKEQWTTTYRRLHIVWDPKVGEPLGMVHNDQLLLFVMDSDELAARRKSNDKKQGHLDMKAPYSAYAHFGKDGTHRTKPILRTSQTTDYMQSLRIFQMNKSEAYTIGTSKLGSTRLMPVKIELGE